MRWCGCSARDGVGQPRPEQAAKARARLGADQRVGGGQGAGREIGVGRADIVVAGEDQRRVGGEQVRRVRAQRLHPAQLGLVAVHAAGIAVGEVEVADRDAGARTDTNRAWACSSASPGRVSCTVSNGTRPRTATPL